MTDTNNIPPSTSLRQRTAQLRRVIDSAQTSLDDYTGRKQADDRSRIAKIIVWLFAILVCVFFLYVGFNSYYPTASMETSTLMLEALKTLVPPILTLVLGYYFGSSKQ